MNVLKLWGCVVVVCGVAMASPCTDYCAQYQTSPECTDAFMKLVPWSALDESEKNKTALSRTTPANRESLLKDRYKNTGYICKCSWNMRGKKAAKNSFGVDNPCQGGLLSPLPADLTPLQGGNGSGSMNTGIYSPAGND